MKNYVLAGAVLAGVLVQVERLRQSNQQHRERAHLVTARMHQRLLADEEANPLMAAVWSESVPAGSEMARAKIFHVNRWVSLWAVQHRTGVLTTESLIRYAADSMRNSEFRIFWEAARKFRLAGARDDVDGVFNRIMDMAYTAESSETVEPTAA